MKFNIIKRIASKELSLLFNSPIAYLFLGTFLAVTLFIFFWVEAFFARNIADVRPLFEWMPILLAFLASTLTMKMWSEEKRQGTIEFVLTQPVTAVDYILGKFLACLTLLVIAIAITLVLPLVVSFIATLDWGPVFAGYFATLLLGATYIAIGLFVSANTENQIVSLIASVAICCILHLLGSETLISFFSINMSAILEFFSTSARFESITRGVLDLRDLWYYLSLIATFLYLNYLALEKQRLPDVGRRSAIRLKKVVSILLIANILISNVWVQKMRGLRIDATAENIYSVSKHTKTVLSQMNEPMLIRAVFSSKTHPLLAPLVPQLIDLLEELQVANANIKVEVIDPATNVELEKEIVQDYQIQPVPLQIRDRHQSSVVSAYFNLLFIYGDSYQVLGFNDLIDIKVKGNSDFEVLLRNPEFDIIKTIKKLMQEYQSGNDIYSQLQQPVTFTGFISANNQLPEQLVAHKAELDQVLQTVKAAAGDKFKINLQNPEQKGKDFIENIQNNFGLRPMRISILNNRQFYYYLFIGNGSTMYPIPIDNGNPDNLKKYIEDGLKRFVPGLTKNIALFNNSNLPVSNVSSALSAEYNITNADLANGEVASEADTLFVLAPEEVTQKQLFAIDQYLMRGGSVVIATGAVKVNASQTNLSMRTITSGVDDLLKHYGVTLKPELVMDQKNMPFPMPVLRDLGGFQVQEIRMLDYPFFADLRDKQLNLEHPITNNIPFLTLSWAHPVIANASTDIEVSTLITSSADSWLYSGSNIMPQQNASGYNFTVGNELQQHTLALELKGSFTSYFKDKDLPDFSDTETVAITSHIAKSPIGSRIIVIGSNEFASDQTIQLIGGSFNGNYMGANQLLLNSASYLLEDEALMSIRGRKHFNRTLPPLDESNITFWEYFSYIVSLLAIIVIAIVQVRRYRLGNKKYANKILA